MSTPTRTILVLGASSNQGGGLVHALAKLNDASSDNAPSYKILGHTRDASSPSSLAISNLNGVELVEGSYEVLPEVVERHKPIYGVFCMQSSVMPDEFEQAQKIIDLAAASGVEHFVYSSVDLGGLEDTGVPVFEVKRKLEEYIKAQSFEWTILRPPSFMTNVAAYDTEKVQAVITFLQRLLFPPDAPDSIKLHWIAPADIGVFAALAFQQPVVYAGKTLELAGDELNAAEFEKAFTDVGIKLVYGTPELIAQAKGFAKGHPFYSQIHQWLSPPAPHARADIAALRKAYPGLKTLRMFLETEVLPARG